MLKYIIWVVILWIVFKVVAHFILPIFRLTSEANKHMRRMQEQLRDMESKMNQPPPPSPKKVNKEGDYIDYEEVA